MKIKSVVSKSLQFLLCLTWLLEYVTDLYNLQCLFRRQSLKCRSFSNQRLQNFDETNDVALSVVRDVLESFVRDVLESWFLLVFGSDIFLFFVEFEVLTARSVLFSFLASGSSSIAATSSLHLLPIISNTQFFRVKPFPTSINQRLPD